MVGWTCFETESYYFINLYLGQPIIEGWQLIFWDPTATNLQEVCLSVHQ